MNCCEKANPIFDFYTGLALVCLFCVFCEFNKDRLYFEAQFSLDLEYKATQKFLFLKIQSPVYF